MALLKRVSLLPLLLLWRALCEGAGLTLKEEMVQWHNQQRSSVSPQPTNMLQLLWSEDLASMAQVYSQTCPQNSTLRNPFRLTNTTTPIGENLLIVNTSELTSSNYSHLLQTHWVDSATLTQTNCTGGSCAEYIQVVWAASRFIGCGETVCNGTTVLVCDYVPGPTDVELVNFTAPYFIGGPPCSECPVHSPNCTDNDLCYAAALKPQTNTTTTSIITPLSTPLAPTFEVTSASTPTLPAIVPVTSNGLLTTQSTSLKTTSAIGDNSTQVSTPVTIVSLSPTSALSTTSSIESTHSIDAGTSTVSGLAGLSTVTEAPSVTQSSSTVPVTTIGVSELAGLSTTQTPVTSTAGLQASISSSPAVQMVTITLTQFCSCDYEFGSGGMEISTCPGQDRLPTLYVILIGVIPSTVAVSLLFLVTVMVCTNRNQRKRAKIRRARLADQMATPRTRRRMQVRDSGLVGASEGIHLRHLSPLHSLNSADADAPLLPPPPSPHFDNDNLERGISFGLVLPNSAAVHQDSSMSSSCSETPPNQRRALDDDDNRRLFAHGGIREDVVRQPMVGLASIHEEGDEGQERTGEGGVASIIARLERGQGQAGPERVITTEC